MIFRIILLAGILLISSQSLAGPMEKLADTVIDSPLMDNAMRNAGQDPDSEEGKLAKELARDGMGTGDSSNMKRRIDEYNKGRHSGNSSDGAFIETQYDYDKNFVEGLRSSPLSRLKKSILIHPDLNRKFKKKILLSYAKREDTAIFMMQHGARCDLDTASWFVYREWIDALEFTRKNRKSRSFEFGQQSGVPQTLFNSAARNTRMFKYLRKYGAVSRSALSSKSIWFLKTAIKASDIRTVKDCLAAGVDPEDTLVWDIPHDDKVNQALGDGTWGKTPIFIVAERSDNESTQILKLLIEAGADPTRLIKVTIDPGKGHKSLMVYKSILDYASPVNKKFLSKYVTNDMRNNGLMNAYINPIAHYSDGLILYIFFGVTVLSILFVRGIRLYIKLIIVLCVLVSLAFLPQGPNSHLYEILALLSLMAASIFGAVVSWRKAAAANK
jgi:hypothetical protein